MATPLLDTLHTPADLRALGYGDVGISLSGGDGQGAAGRHAAAPPQTADHAADTPPPHVPILPVSQPAGLDLRL